MYYKKVAWYFSMTGGRLDQNPMSLANEWNQSVSETGIVYNITLLFGQPGVRLTIHRIPYFFSDTLHLFVTFMHYFLFWIRHDRHLQSKQNHKI